MRMRIRMSTIVTAAACVAGALGTLLGVGCGVSPSYTDTAGPPAATPAAKPAPTPAPAPELRADEEKSILAILSDMRKNQSRGMMNVPEADGRLLRGLVAAANAKHVVEIGTSNGYSGIWICLALKGTGGKLTTYEIDARRASLARENFKRAGVEDLVTLVEGNAHEEITKLEGPIDLVFLDADKGGYMDYLRKLLPLVRVGGMFLAHNTSSHKGGMKEYLDAVTTSPDLETLFLHEKGAGVGVTIKKRGNVRVGAAK
jgi:predicted O-methyltransferase YrrM